MNCLGGSGPFCGVAVGSSFCSDWLYDLLLQAWPSADQSRLRQESVAHHVVNTLGLAELCRIHSKEYEVAQQLSAYQL